MRPSCMRASSSLSFLSVEIRKISTAPHQPGSPNPSSSSRALGIGTVHSTANPRTPLLVRPNCHLKRAPDGPTSPPRAVSDSRGAPESDKATDRPVRRCHSTTNSPSYCLRPPGDLGHFFSWPHTLLAGSGCLGPVPVPAPWAPVFVLHRSPPWGEGDGDGDRPHMFDLPLSRRLVRPFGLLGPGPDLFSG